jgi:predicted dehydrogenase
MRISLIGYGYWGKNWARILSSNPKIEFLSISDSDSKKEIEVKNKYPKTSFYKDAANVLKDKPDAVIISTPVSTHFNLSKLFLQNNVSVLCEKPLCEKTFELEELGKIIRNKDLILMVGHIFEFNKAVLKIKALLSDNFLGDVLYVVSSRCGLGPIRKDVNVISDLATHDISILNFLFNKLPIKASASAQKFFNNSREDMANITLFYENGMTANIMVSWVEAQKERTLKIVGSKKMLIFDDTNISEKIKIIDKGLSYLKDDGDFGSFQLSVVDGDILIPKVENHEPLQLELDHFIECIETNKKPLTDILSALNVVKVLNQINNSLSNND